MLGGFFRAVYLYDKGGSTYQLLSDCELWQRTVHRKTMVVLGALRGPEADREGLERGQFARESFRINGTLYRNPGGCTLSG